MSAKCSKYTMLLTAATLAGLLWRAEGLLRRSLWLDEVLTLWRARLLTVDALLIGLESSPFPPMYYLLLWGWGQVWGIGELTVRALPMTIGVITVPVTYVVWAGLIGRRKALWAVVLLSTNAFHVFYSQDAKMYAAVWLLATVSSGAFLRAIEGGPHRTAWLATYGVSNAALLLTSYVGVVPMAIQLLYVLLAWHRVRPIAGRLAATAALSCVPSLAWLPITIQTVTHRTGITWIPPVQKESLLSELSNAFSYFTTGYRSAPNPPEDLSGLFFSEIYALAGLLAVAAILAYLIQLSRGRSGSASVSRHPGVGLYLALWAALPAMAAFLFSIIVYPLWGPPRYLMASGPAVILLLGSALGSLRQRAPAYLIGAVLLSANAAMILFEKTHVTTDPYRQMVGICATLARGSPELRGESSAASNPLRVIHLKNHSLSDLSAMCVQYEIDEINARSQEALLRSDRLEKAVEHGLAFFVIEIRSASMPVEAARGAGASRRPPSWGGQNQRARPLRTPPDLFGRGLVGRAAPEPTDVPHRAALGLRAH